MFYIIHFYQAQQIKKIMVFYLVYPGSWICSWNYIFIIMFSFIYFPEKLMFGLTKENGENIRACMLFISIWMMVFAIPLFIFTSEPEKNKTNKKYISVYKTRLHIYI